MNALVDGYSQDELLAIGTRKMVPQINLSAADINSKIPYVVAMEAHKRFDGFTEDQLKAIGEHKAQIPAMRPVEINKPTISYDDRVEPILEKMQRFLGVRLK